MMKSCRIFFSGFLVTCGLLLSGCIMNTQPTAVLYDLGPHTSLSAEGAIPENLPPLAVYRVNAPDWLGSTMMYYRLEQVNAQQARFYTLSRWNMPPSKLFRDRLESRLFSADKGQHSRDTPWRLVVHIEDFSQYFRDDSNSEGRIALRVSLLDREGLIARKRFLRTATAPSPDAPGGARALSVAADEIITEILSWIMENSRNKPE